MKKIRYILAGLGLVIGVLLITEQASAHHPEITAEAECSNGLTSVTVAHAEAWQTEDEDHRYNDSIQIAYRAVDDISFTSVGTGKFLPSNGYKFSLAFSVPTSAKQIVVRATALANWGPQQQFQGDSDFREVTVDLPLNCNDLIETTTTTPTFTTIERQTTTTITTGSTTIPPADTIVRQPRFTG